MPFDVVFSRQELAEKYQQGRIVVHPFGELANGGLASCLKLLANMAVFFPLGAMLAATPRWSSRSWLAILGTGLVLTAAIELGQLLVYTRVCDVTDVLTGTLAILAGWWLVSALRVSHASSRPAIRTIRTAWGALHDRVRLLGAPTWISLALAWAVVVVIANWQPFDFTLDPARFALSDADLSDEATSVEGLRRMSWAPFVDYYWGSRYQALDLMLLRSISFAPLGIFLALAFGRRERQGEVVTLLTGLLLASLVEFGQYFIPERHPSVTDLLIEVLGAWLGYRLAQHTARALAGAPASHGTAYYSYPTSAKQPYRRGHPGRTKVSKRAMALFDRVARQPLWVGVVVLGIAGLILLAGILLTLQIALRLFG
jgi:glycopeptide antibiotics resistance protein